MLRNVLCAIFTSLTNIVSNYNENNKGCVWNNHISSTSAVEILMAHLQDCGISSVLTVEIPQLQFGTEPWQYSFKTMRCHEYIAVLLKCGRQTRTINSLGNPEPHTKWFCGRAVKICRYGMHHVHIWTSSENMQIWDAPCAHMDEQWKYADMGCTMCTYGRAVKICRYGMHHVHIWTSSENMQIWDAPCAHMDEQWKYADMGCTMCTYGRAVKICRYGMHHVHIWTNSENMQIWDAPCAHKFFWMTQNYFDRQSTQDPIEMCHPANCLSWSCWWPRIWLFLKHWYIVMHQSRYVDWNMKKLTVV